MSTPLASLFAWIRASPSGHTFTVAPVPGHEDVYLGADAAQRPCLFVKAVGRLTEPSIRTAHVSLHVGQEYTVAQIGSPAVSERFHALRCETADEGDIETFLVLVEAYLNLHAQGEIDRASLTGFFGSVSRLFSVERSSDLDGERQGLWGELFMMKSVRGFAFWAPFWHSETTRKFDFSAIGRRVEVKTVVGPMRIHHFAHRQIYALEGEEIMIASILLRKEDAGLGLRELISEARAALSGTDYYMKLELAIRRAGMETMEEAGPAFDSSEALKSIAWFSAADAPHFTMAEPPGVSQTHYRVDLSTAPSLSEAELREWLDAWVALPAPLPR
jgi:Putative  PD-(D/E)XK family member, (DUF4420)